MKYSRGDFLS